MKYNSTMSDCQIFEYINDVFHKKVIEITFSTLSQYVTHYNVIEDSYLTSLHSYYLGHISSRNCEEDASKYFRWRNVSWVMVVVNWAMNKYHDGHCHKTTCM